MAGKILESAGGERKRERERERKQGRRDEPGLSLSKNTGDLTGEMNDVTELLDLHELVDLDGFGFADSVDVVSSEVDEHDVFRSIFWRREKLGSQDGVLCEIEREQKVSESL